jgi:hypothetical protein
MSIDRYTKTILTIIAVCLVYLCLAVTRWPTVSAQADVQRVVVAGWDDEYGSRHTFEYSSRKNGPLPAR